MNNDIQPSNIAAKMLNLKAKKLRVSPFIEGWRKLTRQTQVDLGGYILQIDNAAMNARIRSQIYRGVYEVSKLVVAESILRLDDHVLELGAGLGLVTVQAAKVCGSNNVTSYEAVPRNVEIIQRNLSLNKLSADVRARAIGDSDGSVDFFVNDDAISSSTNASRGQLKITAPCDDVRRVMNELRPTVLLIDIEGTELDVVPMLELSNVRAVMIQIHGDVVSDVAASQIMQHFLNAGLLYLHMCSIGNVWAFERADS